MESEMRRYARYSRGIKLLLVACGIWPNFHPVHDKIVSYLAAFATFYGTSAVLNFCLHHVTNVMILTKGMGLVITFFSSFLKIVIFLIHHDDLVYLNDVLTGRFLVDLSNIDDRPLLLARIGTFSHFFYAHSIFSGLAIIMYSIIPLIALKHGKYIRMYPSVVPFAYEPGGIVHWCLYGLELTGGFFLWAVTNGVDYVFGLYALQMCGEFRILGSRFENLSVCKDYKKKLRECIMRHHLLIKSKRRLEKTYGLLAIWLAISGALVLCSLVFQVTEIVKSVISPVQMCLLCFYIIPKLMQVFTYAWFGNLIAEESKSCLNSIYNAQWPESSDTTFRSDILFVLQQKPLIVAAKGCMLVQLDLFSKIVNTSVSYFFLLQTLNEK